MGCNTSTTILTDPDPRISDHPRSKKSQNLSHADPRPPIDPNPPASSEYEVIPINTDPWTPFLKSSLPFVPRHVFSNLFAESSFRPEPSSHRLSGYALLIDVSGFTKLTEDLVKTSTHPEEAVQRLLTRTFSPIVSRVRSFGGSIEGFAGDAAIALWVRSQPSPTDLKLLLRQALACALTIQAEHTEDPTSQVQIHMGLGFGSDFELLVVGGIDDHWEVLTVGRSAFRAINEALGFSSSNSVVIHENVLSRLHRMSLRLPESNSNGYINFLLDDERTTLVRETLSGDSESGIQVEFDETLLLRDLDGNETDDSLPSILPSFVVNRLKETSLNGLSERQIVSIIFVRLNIFSTDKTTSLLSSYQTIATTLQSVCRAFHGTLLSFFQDEKATFGLLVFGYPTSSENNSLMALKSSLAIRSLLPTASVGVATGPTYCGLVGCDERRQVSVLSDSVNLAARLSSKVEGGILCDDVTCKAVVDRVEFEEIGNLSLKGKGLVEAFSPIRILSRTQTGHTADGFGSGKLLVYGRLEEKKALLERVERFMDSDEGEGGFFRLEGSSGMGKTSLLHDLITELHTTYTNANLTITQSFAEETTSSSTTDHFDLLRPFFRSLLVDDDDNEIRVISDCDCEDEGEEERELKELITTHDELLRHFLLLKKTKTEEEKEEEEDSDSDSDTNSDIDSDNEEENESLMFTLSPTFSSLASANSALTELLFRIIELWSSNSFSSNSTTTKKRLLILENYQWFDEASLVLLRRINDFFINNNNSKLLIIITSRTKIIDFGKTITDSNNVLKIKKLSKDEIEIIVKDALVSLSLSTKIIRSIDSICLDYLLTRSSGNPAILLFLLRELIEAEEIEVGVEDQIVHLADEFLLLMKDVSLERSSVSGAYRAGIDRLPWRAKDALKIISTLAQGGDLHGRIDRSTVTDLLSDSDSDLIDVLVNHGILVLLEDDSLRFRHVEYQRLSYNSTLQRERARFHRAVSDVLQRNRGLPKSDKLVLTHDLLALKNSVDVEEEEEEVEEEGEGRGEGRGKEEEIVRVAKGCLSLSKELVASFEHVLAASYLRDVAQILSSAGLASMERIIRFALAQVLSFMSKRSLADEVVTNLNRVLALRSAVEGGGEDGEEEEEEDYFEVLYSLWLQKYLFNAGESDFLTLSKEFLTRATDANDTLAMIHAHKAVALSLFRMHEFEEASTHVDAGLDLYEDSPIAEGSSLSFGGVDPVVHMLMLKGRVTWMQGQFNVSQMSFSEADSLLERKNEQREEMMEMMGETEGGSSSSSVDRTFAAYRIFKLRNLVEKRRFEDVISESEIAREYFDSQSRLLYRTRSLECRFYEIWASYITQGFTPDLFTQLQSLFDALDKSDSLPPLVTLCWLEALLVSSTEHTESSVSVDSTFATTKNRLNVSSIYHKLDGERQSQLRLEAEEEERRIALRDEAEASMIRSVKIARASNAKILELRSLLTLSRFRLSNAVRRKESLRDLRVLLDTFAEDDVDDPEVIQSRTLLESLEGVQAADGDSYVTFDRLVVSLFAMMGGRPGADSPVAQQLMAMKDRVESGALNVGDTVPDFTLVNADGVEVNMRQMAQRGFIVLNFFRGSWCPFCKTEMACLRDSMTRFKALNGQVISISPHLHAVDEFKQMGEISTSILVDYDGKVSEQFGLLHEIPAAMKAQTIQMGVNLPEVHGRKLGWKLPIPATYVVNTNMKIVGAFVDINPMNRMEPNAIAEKLEELFAEEMKKKQQYAIAQEGGFFF